MDNERASFNLVDDPWIVVKLLSGETAELSIREVFLKAAETERLTNELPTQDFAILRMLLAVLQRSLLEFVDEYDYPSDAWGALWKAKKLPIKEIEAYLSEWHYRFDLFDEEQPFMQVAGLKQVVGEPAGVEPLMLIPTNRSALFANRTLRGLESITYPDAARWLIHAHAYDFQSPRMAVVGDPLVKNGRRYKKGTGWLGGLGGIYIEGPSFLQTLLLNLILCGDCYDALDDFIGDEDLPVWEQPPKEPGDDMRLPLGYADLYTWQAKRIRLIPSNNKIGKTVFTNGDSLEVDNLYRFEPMTAWELKTSSSSSVNDRYRYVPVRHNPERAVWRGLTALLPWFSERDDYRYLAPGVIEWLTFLSSSNGGSQLSNSYHLKIHAVGFKYDSHGSKVIEMIDDTMTFSSYLLTDAGKAAAFLAEHCMGRTDEAVAKVLGGFAYRLRLAAGDDGSRAASACDRVKAEAYFELDALFRSWLAGLNSSTDLIQAEIQWNRQAHTTLIRLARLLVEDAGPDAIVGRKVNLGNAVTWLSAGGEERRFHYRLDKLLPCEIKPEKEG